VVAEIGRVIGRLKAQGLSILLVEQNLALALDTADRVYVMSRGQIVFEGTPAALRAEPGVAHKFLGV
jgi:branched-chain amino acid transport system ATP-binding protein